MKIKNISIKGLFGLHDYYIDFNEIENIKIIHAPNGYGKTTVLKLLKEILDAKFFEVNSVPFDNYKIKFDNDMVVEVFKTLKNIDDKDDRLLNKSKTLIYRIIKNKKSKEYNIGKRTNDPSFMFGKITLNMIETKMPFLIRVGTRVWNDTSTGERLTYDDVINNYGEELLFLDKELSEELKYIRENIPMHIINANRLIKSEISNDLNKYDQYNRRDNMIQSVVLYSNELANIIENSLAKSGALTQELDRTFPARLIQMMTREDGYIISPDRIIEELSNLEKRRNRLEDVGLLTSSGNATVQPTALMDDSTTKVLSLYIKDTKEKLDIFNEVESKINLMKEIINKRFINKTMKISRKEGFVFELPDKTELTPEKLSSGEQNELVLIYELLFKSLPNSLILIDEPEISLHIAWQQEFLSDMIKISDINGINMLIATHSPDIINGRWDLATGLGEI